MKLHFLLKIVVLPLCVIALGVSLTLTGCHSSQSAQFSASEGAFPFQVAGFDSYLEQVQYYIEDNRVFVGNDKKKEVLMNMPFECGREFTDRGLLLVHGLGDSPFFFRDIANVLCEGGMRVRTILLPGHGTRPGDMLSVTYEQWQAETDFHIEQFSQEVNKLYVGGFSTGANLTTITSFRRDDISGLVLFSPAFQSRFFVSRLAPYVDTLIPWPNVEPEDNPTRYNSTAMPGFSAYQESVNRLQSLFSYPGGAKHTLAIPVFMVVAEHDSVVDTQTIALQFDDRFTHPRKCLVWQGEVAPDVPDETLLMQTMVIPEARFSAASHMSVLFSPSNELYGAASDFRICDNGQTGEKEAQCYAGEEVWFGPWGFKEEGKIHARTTYNPHFVHTLERVKAFLGVEQNAYCN